MTFALILISIGIYQFINLKKNKLVIDKNGISINTEFTPWSQIKFSNKLTKFNTPSTPHNYIEFVKQNGNSIEHRLDFYGSGKVDEIYQAAYMYRQL